MSIENKPKRTRKAKAQLALHAPGILLLNAGITINSDTPTAHLTASTAKLIGAVSGDYVEISNEDHGTQIIRELCTCTGAGRQNPRYVYLDGESLGYLGIDAHEQITVRLSALNIDVP